MQIEVVFGIVWGLSIAVVQHLHLQRSTMAALGEKSGDPSRRVAKTLMGSLVRLVLLTVLFLIAWKSRWIRLDVSLVAFGVFHLLLMFKLGFGLRSRLAPPENPG